MKYKEFDCGCKFKVIGDNPNGFPSIDWNMMELNNINFNCKPTYDMLSKGLVAGCFQIEKYLGKKYCKLLKPDNIEHICALGAILRPGTLENLDEHGVSVTDHFCKRKNNEEKYESYHNSIKDILDPTYQLMIYQEQAMKVAVAVAGFSERQADDLRKACGKKKPEEMAKVKTMFLEGVEKAKIVTPKQGDEIFSWIEKSQRYSFNRCISNDTIIRRINKNKYMTGPGYTVEHLYKLVNDIEYAREYGHLILRRKLRRLGNYGGAMSMCEDGRIRHNTIVDIQPAGKRKIYKVILDNGSFIKSTDNHKFPTPNGIKLLKELKVGENLYVMGD